MSLTLLFVGRRKEAAQLRWLHARRKHVLILGPAGVGKTALVAHLRDSLGLRVCPASERLSEICEALEHGLNFEAGKLHLVRRRNRLLKSFTGAQYAVVFDGVSWTTPKISSFFDCVSEHVPVWVCARSEHSWDIGHFWQCLWKFERVELHPFHLADTRALVEAAVGNAGFECRVATDGSAALETIRSWQPDLAVLDVNMPNRSGFEVLSALRNDPLTREIRVILLTARQQETDVIRGFSLGADDYVIKPFSPMELVARMKRLLGKNA